MPLKDLSLTKEDVLATSFESIIEETKERDCSSYWMEFRKIASEAREGSDEIKAEVLTLLEGVTSLMLRSESPDEPFEPIMVMGDTRTAAIADFSEVYIDLFSQILPDVKDAELRARLADVVWVRKRDYKAAEIAVDSYLDSASTLEEGDSWPPCFERIERAFRIARQLGRKTGQTEKVINHITKTLDKHDGEDPLFLTERLMSLLLDIGEGDPAKYSKLAEKKAKAAEKQNDWRQAGIYWETCAKWYRLGGNKEKESEALTNAAETYVHGAGASGPSEPTSYISAASLLRSAVEAHRRIGNKERSQELYRLLLEYQEKSVNELQEHSIPIDLSDSAKEWSQKIEGKKFPDALLLLAAMFRSPKFEKLHDEAKTNVGKYPIQHLFGGIQVDEKGKYVGYMPDVHSDDEEERETAIQKVMIQNADFHHTIYTQGVFAPSLSTFNLEHNYRLEDILPFVTNNPFVPKGREGLYALGLLEGLRQNVDVALHILIPQLENSFRYVLHNKEVTTSWMNEQGVQSEKPLSALLELPETKEILGIDLSFDLLGLVGDKLGSNFRNRLAHGLMPHEAFFSTTAAYIFWLILHLVFIPIINIVSSQPDQPESPEVESGE